MNGEVHLPLVLALDDPAATLERVGGKGASLARLAAAGLPVPAGFHVTTTAYQRFVQEQGLQGEILAAVSSISIDQPSTLEAASQRISLLFAQHSIPADIAAAIRQAYAELGGGAVAVRSSATAEDLPEMSFAGQQETYLNMQGEDMVLEAVKSCWASLWTARAIGYRARHNIAPEDVSLAVVVQRLVPADAAGILFTVNPLTAAHEQVMINAAWGLGEAIVGGQVTPDTLVVDKESGEVVERQISSKDVMTVRTAEGTHEEPVPLEKRTQPVLSAKQVAELVRLGMQVEQLYKQPMDIEWALHEEHFFLVQARPITALPEPAAPREWKLPKANGRYMRSSVIELMPDPLSPLFTTLGLPAWNRVYKQLGEELGLSFLYNDSFLTTVNGYAYYDLSALNVRFKDGVRIITLSLKELFKLLKTAQKRLEEDARPRYAALSQQWEAVDLQQESAARLLEGVTELVKVASEYYLTIQSGVLPAAYMSEAAFTAFYERLIRRRNDPPALTFLLGFTSEPIRAEQALYDLARWASTQPRLADVLLQLSSEQFREVYQADALAGVDTDIWQSFRERFIAHLKRFGHAIYDLDFAKPVPADDPATLFETLKFFLSGEAPNPYDRQNEAQMRRERATLIVLTRLKRGPRLAAFKKLLKWAQTLAPLREDGLADVGLGWPVVRKMLREIGRRLVRSRALATEDDVFWLTLSELQQAVSLLDHGQTPESYQDIVSKRRATWKSQSTMNPPVALPQKGGTRVLGMDFARFMPARTEQESHDVLKGVGASPGRVTGTARVIHGPDEFQQMQQGDILVARITTPAWTPLFALASGVITDVGGPLSHSSIVAREYHIPAVLGTGMATERLRSGQRVTVNGDVGTVTIHEK
ncbi:pyruvate,water dikinase [Thermosporothrix hazakensis]|jgi:pyruvate,water dikinase|uniref:Phosphoenolpyruvate synthase n=1 Tax=Thermosporothrix hazakensis TaxID=644383 RepID=A0A326UMY1_THEHA|nr:PEP/pyruvate-binding domain-containing protein [Thermosporothrix hazakensis]PZW31225.1 pyruvate,water dikinase [Thermosporothrix hazakensis]GCE50867.1 pyruvate, phosphate dikinase [Thermosporothrix hazakensis]